MFISRKSMKLPTLKSKPGSTQTRSRTSSSREIPWTNWEAPRAESTYITRQKSPATPSSTTWWPWSAWPAPSIWSTRLAEASTASLASTISTDESRQFLVAVHNSCCPSHLRNSPLLSFRDRDCLHMQRPHHLQQVRHLLCRAILFGLYGWDQKEKELIELVSISIVKKGVESKSTLIQDLPSPTAVSLWSSTSDPMRKSRLLSAAVRRWLPSTSRHSGLQLPIFEGRRPGSQWRTLFSIE